MTLLFLASFVVGLLVAVRVMFFGIERPAHPAPAATVPATPRIRFSYAALAAFALLFGVVGYLLVRGGAASGVAFAIAVIVGIVGAFLAGWGAAAWARVLPEHDVEDPRYVLQGHPARVTAAIAPDRDGEIVYEIGDERRTARARLVEDADAPEGGDSSVAVGTEVVIERIDDDVAYVEPWLQVEKRL